LDLVLVEGKRPTRRLASLVAPLADDYDYLFLDCPPSISLVSENVFEAADALLVPLIPTTLSLRTFSQLLDFVDGKVERAPQVIAFFSMVDLRKKLHREVLATLPVTHRSVARATIPALADVENMGVHRRVVGDFAPRSRAARAYEALWTEVSERLGA
jgi:cellulose biosynthesis protein BcsQ